MTSHSLDLNFSVPLNLPHPGGGTPPLLSLLRVSGEDAATFLQGQLTQDVLSLTDSEFRLAAWCSAKGRMLASFWIYKGQGAFYLLLSADLAASTLKRLRMFVLRAKCQIEDVSSQFLIEGLVGDAAKAFLSTIKTIAAPAYSARVKHQNDTEIGLFFMSFSASEGVLMAFRIVSVEKSSQSFNLEHLNAWQALEIQSGIARITAPVTDAFVPQMLNYESVGGVNFKKGCYPGQEVVARSQFRGSIKRRAYWVTSEAPMQAGQEVFSQANEARESCGIVAQSASYQAQHLALICLQTSAVDSKLALENGAALQLQRLPYPLLDDI